MTSKETTAVASDHGSGGEITVWVGVPGLSRGLPSSGSLLLVEAEPQRARELRQVLRDRPEVLVCEEVLAAENEATVRWHRFNDTRLNGPSDLTIWQQRFPNLRQIDEEQRCGRRLGDLLDNWAPREGEQALAHLHLVLRQGDPLAGLISLGPWLSQLETVQLMLPWPAETMRKVESWLAKQSFRQDPQTSALWIIDQVAKRDWLLSQKEKEIRSLLAANQQLNIDYHEVRAEKVLLSEELEKLCEQIREPQHTQDITQGDRHQFEAETERITKQQDILQQACQQLYKEKSELLQQLEVAKAAAINSTKACKALFPLQLYKKENIDLDGSDDNSLLLHYIQSGQYEGRLKPYEELTFEWKTSIKRCEELESKLAQLEAQFGIAHQQLKTLRDLFARLVDRQHSRGQTK
jgi:hypothetical protein